MFNFRTIQLKYGFPLPVLIRKVARQISFRLNKDESRKSALELDSRKSNHSNRIDYLPIAAINPIEHKIPKLVIEELFSKFIDHRFDILGSGWTSASYHAASVGMMEHRYESAFIHRPFENPTYLEEILPIAHHKRSAELYQQIKSIHPSYECIDWNRDIRSGYRFSSDKWSHDSSAEGNLEGVDVKIPWELSRMHHLPQMALFALQEAVSKEKTILEIQAQLLDFYMVCPPNIGINWSCPMDIGIRAANMLMAYNFLILLDTENNVSKAFKAIFAEMIEAHGSFLYHHLEYGDSVTSNHYLANIAGLLFISVFMEKNEQTKTWMKLAIQELNREVDKQFFDEGSNFEGSDSYHRLSTEMLVYSIALIDGLPKEIKDQIQSYQPNQRHDSPYFESNAFKTGDLIHISIREKIYRAAQFTQSILKENGEIPQIGDNDSGRFFRFSPVGSLVNRASLKRFMHLQNWSNQYKDLLFWDENHLNHSGLLSAADGLFDQSSFSKYSNLFPLEKKIVQCLSKNNLFPIAKREPMSMAIKHALQKFQHKQDKIFDSANSKSLLHNFTEIHYPTFGISIFKSDHFYLCIQYGCNNKNHRSWGHKHNDAGAIELQIDGVDILIDRGTYSYTADHKRRNEFRSTASHNTIYAGLEQNEWMPTRDGLFSLLKRTKTTVLQAERTADAYHFAVLVEYGSIKHQRTIAIYANKIHIEDQCNRPFQAHWNAFDNYSNGYGKLMRLES